MGCVANRDTRPLIPPATASAGRNRPRRTCRQPRTRRPRPSQARRPRADEWKSAPRRAAGSVRRGSVRHQRADDDGSRHCEIRASTRCHPKSALAGPTVCDLKSPHILVYLRPRLRLGDASTRRTEALRARSRHVPRGTHSPLPLRASSTRPVPRASSRRRVEPRLHLDVPFLLVFDKIREVLGGGDVADIHAALQALDHEFVGLGAGAEDADEGRVGVFRVARLGGLPVADEIPRVAGLVLGVIQVVDGDAVLAALREVLIDIATDASLGETDEEGARADDDGAGGGAPRGR